MCRIVDHAFIALFFVFGVTTSCISVQMPNARSSPASGVQFESPSDQFVPTSFPFVDKAWKNSTNGNSISFLSECQSAPEESLQSIQRGILQGLQNLSIESSHYKTFNQRQALFTVAKGELDGIGTQLELVVFAKNSCIYVITYTATEQSFSSDQMEFNHFLDGFVVP